VISLLVIMRNVKICNVKSGKCLSERRPGGGLNDCAEGIWFPAGRRNVLCPQMFCAPKCSVRPNVLCPQMFCAPKCSVRPNVLCPQMFCAPKCSVPTNVLCPQMFCAPKCSVPPNVLCPPKASDKNWNSAVNLVGTSDSFAGYEVAEKWG